MLSPAESAARVPGHARRPGETERGKATVVGAAAAGAAALGRVGAAGKQGLSAVGDAAKGAVAKNGTGATAGTATPSTGAAAAAAIESAPPPPVPAPATVDLDVPDLAWDLQEAEDVAPSAPAPRVPKPQRAFDPTPYVLAIMLAAVLFGFIAAVNNLLGARTARTEEMPAQSPAATQTIGERHPDLVPGAVVVLTGARA